jgi:hypothetical protein
MSRLTRTWWLSQTEVLCVIVRTTAVSLYSDTIMILFLVQQLKICSTEHYSDCVNVVTPY